MIKIGLTGNRYSGKDTVGKLFERISIPVFNADVVLKFIINHNFEIVNNIKKNLGTSIFKQDGKYHVNAIRTLGVFDKIVDEAEFELFKAYEKFRLKNKNCIYTIFHSSIIFERKWSEKMDYNISVFSKVNDRMDRCRYLTGEKISDIYSFVHSEMEDLQKNQLSDFIIHNYEDEIEEVIIKNLNKQVNNIDQRIIDNYLKNEREFTY